jgi:uracil-DNA glycosylase family 4
MLTARQQHCLRGIGVRCWRPRADSDHNPPATDLVAAEAEVDIAPAIAAPQPGESRPTTIRVMPPVAATDAVQVPAATPIDIAALDNWDEIIAAIQQCSACELSQNCTQKVPGVGARQADLLIVGEGPGHDEDLRGEPFVGRSGQLLDRMLAAIGIAREQVFITNIVKCRPPNNRDPRSEEAAQCRAYLDAQIRQLQPRLILAVGRVSAHNLLDSKLPVGKLIQHMHQLPGTDIPLKVTYHPAYLLRNPAAKAIAWQDMKLLQRMLR